MSSEIKAVLVTRDTEMIGIFSDRFRSLGVETESVDDLISVANRWLRSKIEAIVLDFDGIDDELAIFAELRKNPSNRNAIVVGVATEAPTKRIAFSSGAQFILQRPFELGQVDRALHAAHRLMIQGRREYFRLAVSLDVSVRRNPDSTIECTSINICRNGMAINTPKTLIVGESLRIKFLAPTSQVTLEAEATVVWDDGHGKAGLRFECINGDVEQHLYTWLDDQCLLRYKVS
ncbi:MAG: PilZ domain-containing protein [Terriglobales bacterium]|jgi:DNA-binding response OmpR family regulator|nr:PilZ domain-containing protein [Terriglobales bacterium]